MTVLAGDIGGTKTVLALYSHADGAHKPLAEKTYPSAQHESLDDIVRLFLAEHGGRVDAAAFGVAGPVIRGQAQITNLPWRMSESGLGQVIGNSHVKLLNDLESIANAIVVLKETDVVRLNDVEATAGGAIGVVAPGTGLGEAFLVADSQSGAYRAHPSEGGHCDFAPNTELELEMLRFLLPVFDGHVSYERVCSGLGIPNVYQFMRWRGVAELIEVENAIQAAADPTPIIVNNALSNMPSPRCKATLDMFCTVLAAQAGNLALTVMATGGLYLGGGIPPRILPALQNGAFLRTFLNKGRLRTLMDNVPLRVITNANAALMGAARVALDMAQP
jgi:glucokinase